MLFEVFMAACILYSAGLIVNRTDTLKKSIRERILVLDGAMGTLIQGYGLDEDDFRGKDFADHGQSLLGCNDLLGITAPQVLSEIHCLFLAAGADIIETNTFNATSVAMADYGLQDRIRELNLASASVAVAARDAFEKQHPGRPRFVAGSLGPTNKTASLSPDVNDPGFRAVHHIRRAWSPRTTSRLAALVDGRRRCPAARDDLRHC